MFSRNLRAILFIFAIAICATTIAYAQDANKGLLAKQKIEGNAGKRWAICIGINNYEESEILDLEKARSDAKAVGEVLAAEDGGAD